MDQNLQMLLKWSLTQTDGLSSSDDVKPMSEERREWLKAALNKYVMDETERINLIVRMLEYKRMPTTSNSTTAVTTGPTATDTTSTDSAVTSPASSAPSTALPPTPPAPIVPRSTHAPAASKTKEDASDLIRAAKEAELDSRLAAADSAGLITMKENGLEELVDRLCQIDNSKFFALKHGGGGKLPLLLNLMQPGHPSSIRWRAAGVFATVVQNNPEPQAKAIELGSLGKLMQLVTDEQDPKVRTKIFYALSSMVRGEATAQGQEAFFKAGGLQLLVALIGGTGPACPSALRNKALFSCLWFFDGNPQLRRQFVKQKALPHILPLIGSEDIDTSEKALQVLLLLARDEICVRALRVVQLKDVLFSQALKSLAKRLESLTDADDIEYNEERLSLIRQISKCIDT